MKYLIGIVIGILLAHVWPDLLPWAKSAFLDSGARDVVVDSLKEIK